MKLTEGKPLLVYSVSSFHNLGLGYEAKYTNRQLILLYSFVLQKYPKDVTIATITHLLLQLQETPCHVELTNLCSNWKQTEIIMLLGITQSQLLSPHWDHVNEKPVKYQHKKHHETKIQPVIKGWGVSAGLTYVSCIISSKASWTWSTFAW